MNVFRKMSLVILSIIWLSEGAGYAQTNGFGDNYSTVASVSGQGEGIPESAIDNDINTFWTTDSPLPWKYVKKEDQNVLLGKVSLFSFSDGVNTPGNVVDGNTSVGIDIEGSMGNQPWMEVDLTLLDEPLILFSLRGKTTGTDLITVWGYTSSTDSIQIAEYRQEDNFILKFFELDQTYVKLRFQASEPFTVYELAGLSRFPKENITLDLGAEQSITEIKAKIVCNEFNIRNGIIYASTDGNNWQQLFEVDLSQKDLVSTPIAVPTSARYIKAEFEYPLFNNKVNIYELQYGTEDIVIPDPDPSPDTLSVTTSGTGEGVPKNAIDKDLNTFWTTDSPLPWKYVSKEEQNTLLGNVSGFSFSNVSGNPVSVVDGNTSVGVDVVGVSGNSPWMELDLTQLNDPLILFSLRGKTTGTDLITVWGYTSPTDSIKIAEYRQEDNFILRYFELAQPFVKLRFEASEPFTVYEVAGLSQYPKEHITLDLGSEQSITAVKAKIICNEFKIRNGVFYSSLDGVNWSQLFDIDLSQKDFVTTSITSPTVGRYVRAEFEYPLFNNKVNIYEIEVEAEAIIAFDPDAGLADNYADNAIISASSTDASNTLASNAVDKNFNTFWVSKSPFPNRFVSREDQNLLLEANNIFQASGLTNPQNMVDGNASGGSLSIVKRVNGEAWLEIDIAPYNLTDFFWMPRLFTQGTLLQVYGITAGQNPVLLDTYTETSNNILIHHEVNGFDKIRIEGNLEFRVVEVAGFNELPKEFLVLDLGEVKPVGQIITKMDANSTAIAGINLQVSLDSIQWSKVANIPTNLVGGYTAVLQQEVPARYVKLEYAIKISDYLKASCREIAVFDGDGVFGSIPQDVKFSESSIREILGTNGFWGWGTAEPSVESINKPDRGPDIYSPLASYARNYHYWFWDVPDPDIVPDFDDIAINGTFQKPDVKWDSEYAEWKRAGFSKIIASIMLGREFTADKFDDPFQAGYNYGYAFASHFGPTNGNGLIYAMEVGNEPWEIDDDIYREVLYGMASGAKAADPQMIVLAGAFQANDAFKEFADSEKHKNYIGAKVSDRELPFLDAINTHAYSYKLFDNGVYASTYPEDPKSIYNAINNVVRWRDNNAPGKPVYLTEWGWDSFGVDSCGFPHCVSEKSGSDYALRGLMKAIRSGIEKATWFHYANTPFPLTGLYSRSGFTGSRTSDEKFGKKIIYYSVLQMLSELGDQRLLSVEQETENGWLYVLGDADGTPTHLMAWLPITGDDPKIQAFDWTTNFGASAAYILDGASAVPTPIAVPTNVNGQMRLQLRATPILIKLDNAGSAQRLGNIMETVEENLKNEMLVLSPNPTSGTVKINLTSAQKEKLETIRVMNLLGQQKGQLQIDELNQIDLPKLDLNQGTYIMILNFKDGVRTIRFIWKE